MNRQKAPRTASLLSELHGFSRSLAELDGSSDVKYIANMWISRACSLRVVHRLSTGFPIYLFSDYLLNDCRSFIDWDLSFNGLKDHISDPLLIIVGAHLSPPHPLPLKCTGLAV
jgi:hypothetical protein